MKIFQQSQEREDLQKIEEAAFAADCREQFTEKSLAATNSAKVRTLSLLSYLPNILSATTAGFFVLYLLSGYTQTVAIVLGALLLMIVVAIEVGKRYLISGAAKDRYTIGKVAPLAIGALVLLFGASMGASYMGGKALVVETASPPDRPHNPEVDSLKSLLSAELATIDRLQKTTWKGKVTSDAVKGINRSKQIQTSITDRIMVLEAQNDAEHTTLLQKHTAKHLNFGYLLGGLAALADIFLLGMIWTAWHLRYQVAAVHAAGKGAKQSAQQSADTDLTQETLKALKAATQAAQDAALAATAATHAAARTARIDTYGHNPAHLNNAPPERKIGFTAGRNDTTENRNTENRNTENRNTETIVQKEFIELTDRVRTCAHCGDRFTYHHSRAKYCSEQCRIAAWQHNTGRTFRKKTTP
jgi:hypothetical protein